MPQSRECRRAADARRRLREPYRKLFDHIRQACRSNKPKFSRRLISILGYTFDDFKRRITSTFSDGMTWDAFVDGHIHIDHIVPMATFDRTSLQGIRQAWALSNIRASWPKDNLSKLRADRAAIRAARSIATKQAA